MDGIEAIRQLIFDALERRHQSARELALEAGVSPATVSHILTGRVRRPSTDTVVRLAPYLGVPEDQLLGLAGHRSADQERPASRDELLDRLLAVDATEVPFYDVAASASPGRSLFADAPAEYAYLPDRRRYRKGRIKGITVRGNCLAPAISDGDRVFIDTQADYEDGDLVLAVVEEALHLKRLRSAGDGWELAPDDGQPAIPVGEQVVVLGKFIGLWRQAL